jgi:predicted  nucleic acid-binding Zn-ribbon protein
MIKKLFFVLFSVAILAGCETIDAVVHDATELKASVVEKVAEIRTGIDSLVTDARAKYELLLEKKTELETMVAEINEAVTAMNKLLGKDDIDATETADLRATIAELQSALDAANSALDEVETTEENLEENSIAESSDSNEELE